MGDLIPVQEKRYTLSVVQSAEEMKAQLAVLQDVCKHYLTNKVDYGLIPGTGAKPVLFKPGAEKLMDVFGLAVDPVIESKTEDWETGLFDYTIKAYIKTRDGKLTLSSALGSCSSFESKYRYVTKKNKITCPSCDSEGTILKSKFPDKKTGDIGWWCKNEACKVNYPSTEPAIVAQIEEMKSQPKEKEQREDMADVKNTILKMAEKRAVVAAVIRACRAAEIFTQDMEDLSEFLPGDYLDVEWKDVTGEGEKAPEGKPPAQTKSTGKKESASAAPAGGSSQQSQGPAPGAGGQTTPKSPAKDAAKNQESPASTGSAPNASGGQTVSAVVSDEEYDSLKKGIWKAAKDNGYSVDGFKAILKNKFKIDADNFQDIRGKLNSSTAGEISFWFGSNKAQQEEGENA